MADNVIKNIEKEIEALCEKLITDAGMELVDLEYRKEGRKWILRAFIDKKGGVTIDDCADISRELSLRLDVEDMIESRYLLEVSSPGINRRLKNEKDFIRSVGKKVKIQVKIPINDRKNFSGILTDCNSERLEIKSNDKQVFEIDIENILKARLNEEIKI